MVYPTTYQQGIHLPRPHDCLSPCRFQLLLQGYVLSLNARINVHSFCTFYAPTTRPQGVPLLQTLW